MSGCRLFCRPGALEYRNSHRRYENLNGILTVIARTLLRALCPRIDIAIAAEFLAVTVENLFVLSIIRNADLIILIDKRGEVADDQKVFLFFCPSSHKYKHIFIGGNIVDPLKARRIVVLLVQRRLVMIKLQQCLHIALQLRMLVILQQIPLQTFRLAPLGELCEILSHEQKLLARMGKHESIGCAEICKLELALARHLADHRALSMHDLIVRKGQNKVLAVRIDHTERQLTVVMGTEDRIELHIIKEIIHPAHVPLIIKAKSALFYRRRHLRPCSRLLCYQKRTVRILFINRIQMLEKFNCLEILIATVNICYPLTVVLAIVKIQHRSDRVHPDTVCMVYIFPEQCIGNQEVRYLRTSVIVNQCAPVRMGALTRIEMLVQAGAIERTQSERIARKMSRYPVQNDTNPLLMHIVHEIHKILRRAIPGGRCIVTGHLIAP